MTINLRNIFPTKAIDVVTVLTSQFVPAFPAARPIKASVNENATFFKHPLEDSTSRTDHIIFNPIEITMSMFVSSTDYRGVYGRIKSLYLNQDNLTIQTRTDLYDDMYIQAMPHDEDPELFNSVIIVINFVETQVARVSRSFLPANPIDSNIIDRGQQEPDADIDESSLLGRVARVFL